MLTEERLFALGFEKVYNSDLNFTYYLRRVVMLFLHSEGYYYVNKGNGQKIVTEEDLQSYLQKIL